jgi:glycerol-3-phosphate cytidylyltransferase
MIIGYAGGTWDMFHIGHLNILKAARSQCDRLIVGVKPDEAVFQSKQKYPIIPYNERCEILRAIRYVDAIVPLDRLEADLQICTEIGANVQFIGSDYKGTPYFNKLEQDFARAGKKLIFLPYTENTSSTILREKLLGYGK